MKSENIIFIKEENLRNKGEQEIITESKDEKMEFLREERNNQ